MYCNIQKNISVLEWIDKEMKKGIEFVESWTDVSDIKYDKFYHVVVDKSYSIPLKFVHIIRRGPDMFMDTEIWQDEKGRQYQIDREHFDRRRLVLLPNRYTGKKKRQ